MEQQGRECPRQNAPDHHGEGAEDRRAGTAQCGRDRLVDRCPTHHLVANSGYRVDAVIDAEADAERNHRDGVNRQADIARIHVNERAEVRHHARDDEECARGDRPEAEGAAEKNHQQHESQVDDVEFVQYVIGREIKSRHATEVLEANLRQCRIGLNSQVGEPFNVGAHLVQTIVGMIRQQHADAGIGHVRGESEESLHLTRRATAQEHVPEVAAQFGPHRDALKLGETVVEHHVERLHRNIGKRCHRGRIAPAEQVGTEVVGHAHDLRADA